MLQARIARFLIAFWLVKKTHLSRSLCRAISCLASGRPLRRWKIVHLSAVRLSKFRRLLVSCWIIQLQFEQHSTGSQISHAFAAASFCGFSEVRLRLRTCGCFLLFLHALTTVCVLIPSYMYNLRNSLLLFGNDASRLGILYLLE